MKSKKSEWKWLLVSEGHIQLWEQDGKTGMVLAGSFEAAKKIAEQFAKEKKVSPAKIGTIQGETLECHIEGSIENGANGAWITDDGVSAKWYEFD